MRYQAALFALRVIKICYMLAYDVAFQCLFIPLWIWNGLQACITSIGLCGSPHGQYFELLFAPLFFLTIAFMDTIAFIGFGWI